MNIGIVGLGLIGGSLAKAISKRTKNHCFGIDNNPQTIKKAIKDGAIIDEISQIELKKCDIVIVCLYPKQTIEFILKNEANFKKGGIVIDTCGIKNEVEQSIKDVLLKNDVDFIGCHPMAGREFSGYDYSIETLFDNASFIMIPLKTTLQHNFDTIKSLAKEIGFKKIIVTDTESHDKTIAYTSQLAHVVSNAYVKSPTIELQSGFTGGSFQDLTRVAKLNEDMWTDLFFINKDNLVDELENYIGNLKKYLDALKNDDKVQMKNLLKEGRIIKEKSME